MPRPASQPQGQATPGDADLARGAGANVAAIACLTVTGMTTDEASKMGVLD
ncbi:MAG: hypothetical protein IPK79_01315 [Vampirovibrionales bacterium]|nr:hypothetical protein [Vampirovibrionales bacterium]